LDFHATWTLGLLMVAALLAGGLGQLLHLPRVTSYLLMGAALGPSLLDWVPHEHIHLLHPLTNLAMALVLFNLGCHFPFARAKRLLRRGIKLSAGELAVTFLFVVIGLPLLGESWEAAVLLGALALATAPATTILVLKEFESEGPVTEYTQTLVVLNNLASIVLFELLFVAVHFFQDKLGPSPFGHMVGLVQDLIGSLVLGVAAGLAVSFFYGVIGEGRRLALLVAMITLVMGACDRLEVPYLVTFLAMGVTMANSSYHGRQVLAELDRLTGLLCVLFFVTHGAELDIHALFAAGLIGIGYVVLRTLGKYAGITLAAQVAGEEPAVRTWLGTAMMAQAGAAIALTAIACRRDPALGQHLQTIILGTVVIFEIAGPLLIRMSVLQAAEVPLAQALHRGSFELPDQIRTVWNRLLLSLGWNPWNKQTTEELTINELMRKKITTLAQSATFDEVVSAIEHSRDNTYPVVGDEGELLGVIRYRELSHALFDRELGSLVRAADVTTPAGRTLFPDDPLSRALAMFQAGKDDIIPVVTRDKPNRLLGVMRRRDVLRHLIRGRTSG